MTSKLEAVMELHLRAHNIPYEREVRFHPERKWRLDFALPGKVGIEIEGGIWQRKSGHNTGKGIQRDIDKGNEAARLGWRLFRFSGDDVKSGRAIEYIRRVLEE